MGMISSIYNMGLNGRRKSKGPPKKKKKKQSKQFYEHPFYDSKEWLKLRYRVLQRFGAACMVCGRTRNDGVRMHVDHIKPRSTHPELQLTFDNLQVLCHQCNLGKSNTDSTDWRSKQKTGPKIPAR